MDGIPRAARVVRQRSCTMCVPMHRCLSEVKHPEATVLRSSQYLVLTRQDAVFHFKQHRDVINSHDNLRNSLF